jgi:hypothetical protein
MTRNVIKYGALGIVAIASILNIATASAGPCAAEIMAFENALPRDKNGELAFIGTAPQSIDAQLEHQPTRDSVERAKRQSQTLVVMVLAQAEAFDSEGKSRECADAIAKARRLLSP